MLTPKSLVAFRIDRAHGAPLAARSWRKLDFSIRFEAPLYPIRQRHFTDVAVREERFEEHAEKFDGENYWIHERGPMEWNPSGEEALNRAEFWQALRACLGKLPQRIADVFTMREMDDVPSKEVCAALNITVGNLWVMLHRARMALRQCLEMNYFTDSARKRP